MLHLLGDDSEALARIAGAGSFDQRVQCQERGLAVDIVDVADLARGEAFDFMCQIDDSLRIGYVASS